MHRMVRVRYPLARSNSGENRASCHTHRYATTGPRAATRHGQHHTQHKCDTLPKEPQGRGSTVHNTHIHTHAVHRNHTPTPPRRSRCTETCPPHHTARADTNQVRVLDVKDLMRGGHPASDALVHGHSDVHLPLHGPQLVRAVVGQEERAPICLHHGVGTLHRQPAHVARHGTTRAWDTLFFWHDVSTTVVVSRTHAAHPPGRHSPL
jgi:hypothetical protein